MNQPGTAIERQILLVAQDIGDPRVDAPLHLVRQAARDQFLAELDKLLAIDGGLLIGEDEEADIVFRVERLDFIDDLLRVANAVVAPEFPL